MADPLTGLGKLVGKMRKEADKAKSEAAAAGYTFASLSTMESRVSVLTSVQVYIQDQSLHIEDRVSKLDLVITGVGMPWGRGRTNPIWDELYTSWRGLSQWWKMFKSQRYVFTQYLVKVEQYEKTGEQEVKDKSGLVTTQDIFEWVEHTLSPISVVKLEERDPKTIKIAEVIEMKSTQHHDPDPAFTENQIEQFIKDFGEIVMIETGLLILNYAWDELDVTPNTIITLTAQAGMGIQVPRREVPDFGGNLAQKPGDKQ